MPGAELGSGGIGMSKTRQSSKNSVLASGFRLWIPRPTESPFLENLLEMQITGPYSRPANQKLKQVWDPDICGLRDL